jgi:hypothetical protein
MLTEDTEDYSIEYGTRPEDKEIPRDDNEGD